MCAQYNRFYKQVLATALLKVCLTNNNKQQTTNNKQTTTRRERSESILRRKFFKSKWLANMFLYLSLDKKCFEIKNDGANVTTGLMS